MYISNPIHLCVWVYISKWNHVWFIEFTLHKYICILFQIPDLFLMSGTNMLIRYIYFIIVILWMFTNNISIHSNFQLRVIPFLNSNPYQSKFTIVIRTRTWFDQLISFISGTRGFLVDFFATNQYVNLDSNFKIEGSFME